MNRARTIVRILLAAALMGGLPSATPAQEVFQEIVVAPGDTMWGIANKYLKDPRRWPDIVKHNQLPTSDPTIALPGTKIKLPIALIKEEFLDATLISMVQDVRFRRKGTDKWDPAKPQMKLKYEDGLRTMDASQARVRFPSKEVVQINENTYIILKPEKIMQEVELLEGNVRASQAKIIMPQGTVVRPRGVGSDYQAKIRPDATEVVFVYKGKVDVTAQGKTVTVPEGYGTEVRKASPPIAPVPLPTFPDFDPAAIAMAPPSVSTIKNVSGDVTIEPRKPTQPINANRSQSLVSKDILVSYHLQLSKDENFKSIVLEKTVPIGQTFALNKEKIPDGKYHMRVAFLDALGVMGNFSQPTTIVKDTVAPEFKDITPADGKEFRGHESFCDVNGTVIGAAILSINEEVIFVTAEGRFNKFLNLYPGENTISIVARDVNGNETALVRKVKYIP